MRRVRERPRVAAAAALALAALVALSVVVALAVGGGDPQARAERSGAQRLATHRGRELRTARRDLDRTRSAARRSQARIARLERRQRQAVERELLRRTLRGARRRLIDAGLPAP